MTPPPATNRAELTIVRRDAPRARRHVWRWAAISAVLLIAGAVAASTLTVNTNKNPPSALYAERFNVGDSFTASDSSVWPAKAAHAAVGVQGAALEMTSALPAANTALAVDQWVYTATIKESAAGRVTSGNFTAELFLDEVSLGQIFFQQGTVESGAVEGLKASWGIGSTLSTSALYYVVVKPFVQVGPTVEYTVKSVASGPTWVGVGGSIDGQTNPTITISPGTTLKLTGQDGDACGCHDIGIKDASHTVVSGWSPDISAGGAQTIVWTPTAAGSFTYECKYHATMKGTITVS